MLLVQVANKIDVTRSVFMAEDMKTAMGRYNSEVNMWVPFVVLSTVQVPDRDHGHVLLCTDRLWCQGIGKLFMHMLGEERPNIADIVKGM